MIEIRNLVKRYGDTIALDHVDLRVEKGEILGLLGPNGSGKTTAINCMLALLSYDKGTIRIMGEEMKPSSYELKRSIGVVPQQIALFYELSVQENIAYFCSLYIKDKKRRKKLVEEAIEFVSLQDYRSFRPGKLSGGLLRRLNIACGIAHKPSLIFMDEPTVAVDPQSRNAILEGIRRLNSEGATIIYTSHYMEEVEEICSRIVIMDKGRVLVSGTKEELKAGICLKEKISIEHIVLNEQELAQLSTLFELLDYKYKQHQLQLTFTGDKTHLPAVLALLEKEGISYGAIATERPTLNDVFLEITGKQLRD